MASARSFASLVPLGATARNLTRRRFLLALGVLAGAGVSARVWRGASRTTRVDVTRPGLGTWLRIVARHSDESLATRAVHAAFAEVARVDAQMSIHRPDSQLSRVNDAAGDATVEVDVVVLDVVELALEGARRSGGVYDPSVLPLMKVFGFYGAPRTGFPEDRAIARVMERVGWQGVRIDRGRGTLGLIRSGAGLDLGSIGKGWAVDRAAAALRRFGIRDGLVDAGGNIYAFGGAEDGVRGWSVGTVHPITQRVERVFVLDGHAVATSGNTEQYRVLGGLRVGHLFDARRGRPADGHLAVTVQAHNATLADRMSTAAYLLGPDRFDWPDAEAVHFVG